MNKHLLKFRICGIGTLVSILALELSADHLLTNQLYCSCSRYYGLIVLAIALLVLSLVINRKNLFRLRSSLVIKDLIKNTFQGNMLDIFYIVFFLLHLTWIPDSLFEWMKADFCFWHPIIYLSGLIAAIFFKPTVVKPLGNNHKILISSISDFKSFPNGDSTIETLLKPMSDYPHIEKIVIFIDPGFKIIDTSYLEDKMDHELLEQLKKITVIDDCSKEILKKTISTLTSKNDITLVDCTYEVIQTAYNIIEKQTNLLLENGYKDSQLLYNITPGNKNISVALALNSIKADRDICYISQSGNQKGNLITEELNVIHLKDIFSELI